MYPIIKFTSSDIQVEPNPSNTVPARLCYVKKFLMRLSGKIKASASKHSAVSYKHVGKQVEQLTAKAEKIDNILFDGGLSIPDEIVRRAKAHVRLD